MDSQVDQNGREMQRDTYDSLCCADILGIWKDSLISIKKTSLWPKNNQS